MVLLSCPCISSRWPMDDFIYFVDHIQWRKRLISDIVRMSSANAMNDPIERQSFFNIPISDHRACRLGKWYYGVGQQFKDCPYFAGIEESHAKFHQLGNARANSR